MLDVARHFFPPAEVKRLIDLMALYKLNRLHLHLSDDQGWRIAIRSWPRLTSVGGRSAGRRRAGRVLHAARVRVDRRVRARAVRRRRARRSTCRGTSTPPSPPTRSSPATASRPRRDTGIEVGFSSLCIRKELTYTFVDDVVREVAALTPGPYIHVGGDEAHSTDPDEYRAFIERVETIVRSHGKRMIGWEEVAKTKLRRTSVAQHWHDPALSRAGRSSRARSWSCRRRRRPTST